MSPLPGTPPFMRIGMEAGSYPIPEREKAIIELYERVTSPTEIQECKWQKTPNCSKSFTTTRT
jgi:putative component of membrane protein insertase Oxa1/YidC/SpoIIIJ protein YidD